MHPSKLSPLRNGPPRVPDPRHRLLGGRLRRGHPRAPGPDRLRDPRGDALPAPQQDAARGTARLRLARVDGGTAAQVLPIDRSGADPSRRVSSVLGVPDHTHRRTGKVAMDKTIVIGLSGHAEQFRLDAGRLRPAGAVPRPGRRPPARRPRPGRGHRRPRAVGRRQARASCSDPTIGSSPPRISTASSTRSARSTPARIRRPTRTPGRARALVGCTGSAKAS